MHQSYENAVLHKQQTTMETLALKVVSHISSTVDRIREVPPGDEVPLAAHYSALQPLVGPIQQLRDDLPSNYTAKVVAADDSRLEIVQNILWPLLTALTDCYTVLDAIQPAATTVASGDGTTKKQQQQRPPPPPGMLSLRHYTDIACLIEYTICVSLVPFWRHTTITTSTVPTRTIPKAMEGRLTRTFWKRLGHEMQTFGGNNTVKNTNTNELTQTATILAKLLLLDRFRPMLLPRHTGDLLTTLFHDTQQDELQTALRPIPTILQARACQVLLQQPQRTVIVAPWFQQAVSHHLSVLAATDLAALLPVFVTPQDPSTAQRLARVLVQAKNHHDKISLQLFEILRSTSDHENLPLPVLHYCYTCWYVLREWSAPQRNAYLQRWLLQKKDSHGSVAIVATLLSTIPPGLDAVMVMEWIFLPRNTSSNTPWFTWWIDSIVRHRDNDNMATMALLRKLQSILLVSGHDHAVKDLYVAALLLAVAPTHEDWTSFESSKLNMTTDDSLQYLSQTVVEGRFRFVLKELLLVQSNTSTDATATPESTTISILFSFLLRLYFETSIPAVFVSSRYRLVALVALPVLCEECPISSLLAMDKSLLDMMRFVFETMARRNSMDPIVDSDERFRTRFDTATALLLNHVDQAKQKESNKLLEEHLGAVLGNAHGDSGNNNDVLLAVAVTLLSILASALELGAPRRTNEEESTLRELIPSLRQLAEYTDERTVQVKAQSEFAEMASHIVALIASREAETSTLDETAEPSHADKLKQTMLDLQSPEPPLRARGVVQLRHLAAAGVLQFAANKSEHLFQLLRLSIEALGDAESYVYLAAVHTISVLVDSAPAEIIPCLGETLATAVFKPTGGEPEESPSLTNEQQIKLAEALIFAIRRRAGIIHEYIPFLLEVMVFGHQKCSNVTESKEESHRIQEATHNYFMQGHAFKDDFEVSDKDDLEEVHSPRQVFEEKTIRMKAGGPLFQSEEDDAVHASQLNIVSELVEACLPGVLARFTPLLCEASINALQLDASRPVRRAAALLVTQLYGAVLREEQEAQAMLRDVDIPFVVSLVNSSEARLATVLERCCSGQNIHDFNDSRAFDPAVAARCEEALELRNQANISGILLVARAIAEDQRHHASNPIGRLLKKGKESDAVSTHFGILELE